MSSLEAESLKCALCLCVINKCDVYMGILDDFGSNFGINLHLRFIYIFLRLHSALALLSFDCRFEYFWSSHRRKARS